MPFSWMRRPWDTSYAQTHSTLFKIMVVFFGGTIVSFR
jgi:hypothetical protein